MNKHASTHVMEAKMGTLTKYTSSEARNNFSDVFNEAHFGQPVLIEKQGKKVAVVSIAMLERLAELEAAIDNTQALGALEEFRKMGGRKMEDIEKELGLD